MRKLFLFFLPALFLFFNACHSNENEGSNSPKGSVDSVNIFPVTSFIKGRLNALDTMPITPLRITTENGRTDSLWMKREDIRKNATPFLSPIIDSVNMHSLFSQKSFLDQTINAYTFTYDAKEKLPDSINLIHWDVYMNPQTNSIERIYMVKEKNENNKSITTQLTWLTNKWFSIRTITQTARQKAQVQEEKMIWDFDD